MFGSILSAVEMYMLIDCDNFFVSCERLKHPEFNNTAVIVLGGHESCVVSRSNEVKELKIKVGEPYFKIKDLVDAFSIKIFEADIEEYSCISSRIMRLLRELDYGKLEIYSIDEAYIYIDFKIDKENLLNTATYIRNKILLSIGISVSIGIAKTKTLAKIATDIAKHNLSHVGYIDSIEKSQKLDIDIGSVWGIGYKTKKYLNKLGIYTIGNFLSLDEVKVVKSFNVNISKTYFELKGIDCIKERPKDNVHQTQMIRTFKKAITEKDEIRVILMKYIFNLSLKLRESGVGASEIKIYLATSRFKDNKIFSSSMKIELTNDFNYLMRSGDYLLSKLDLKRLLYKKIGVIFSGISTIRNNDIFSTDYNAKQIELQKSIDKLNKKWGRKSILPASIFF